MTGRKEDESRKVYTYWSLLLTESKRRKERCMNDDIGLAKQGTAQTRNFSSRHSDLQFKKHVPKITKSIFEKQGVDPHNSRGKYFGGISKHFRKALPIW